MDNKTTSKSNFQTIYNGAADAATKGPGKFDTRKASRAGGEWRETRRGSIVVSQNCEFAAICAPLKSL
jgi:hypothetical protein